MKSCRCSLWSFRAAGHAAAHIVLASFVSFATAAQAQQQPVDDHAVVLEFGGAAEWPTHGGAANFGGTIAGEITPIEHWLEIEAGVTALGSTGRTELSGDLLFKKPWSLSPRFEFMLGAGPSWARTTNGPDKGTLLSAEFVLDFMFWQRRNIGWYIEPGWSVAPKTWDRSIGINGGLLIGLP